MLTPHTPLGWFFGFAIRRRYHHDAAGRGDLAVSERCRHLGHHHAGCLGLRDYQLRLVDRYWTRRYADFRNPLAVQTEMAQLHQPVCGSHDTLRRRLRGYVPCDPYRTTVAGNLLALPLSDTMNYWPQFRSPLIWDVFAVSTYATISVVFWYIGMIPDLGTLRDRAKSKFGRFIYGQMALGWRGSARHWMRYESACLLLAGLATPLVLSVHTVISFDFAGGDHAGLAYNNLSAVFRGWRCLLWICDGTDPGHPDPQVLSPGRSDYDSASDNCGKVMLVTGFIVAYGYMTDIAYAWYSADKWEFFMAWNRMFGPMGWSYWILIFSNIAFPLTTLWSRRLRHNVAFLFVLSLIVNTGMWFERFVIVVTSLTRDYLPSSWGTYRATRWDYMTFVGTLGLFTFLFFLFIRLLPMIPMSEIRQILPGSKTHESEMQNKV